MYQLCCSRPRIQTQPKRRQNWSHCHLAHRTCVHLPPLPHRSLQGPLNPSYTLHLGVILLNYLKLLPCSSPLVELPPSPPPCNLLGCTARGSLAPELILLFISFKIKSEKVHYLRQNRGFQRKYVLETDSFSSVSHLQQGQGARSL